MRFVLGQEQLGFFFRNGYLGLELPMKEIDCITLSSSLRNMVELRLPKVTENASSLQILFGGRDMWRDSILLQKIIQKGPIAKIATSLWWSEGGVRLLYDQLISFSYTPQSMSHNPFFQSLQEGYFDLSRYSSFSDILGGVALCLESNVDEISEETPPITVPFSCLLSHKVAGATCISRSCRIKFPCVKQGQSLIWYLVVFGKEKSRYIFNERDPHTNRPKRLGYFFNDFLTSDRNPFVDLPSPF
ncbi:hypothetical protein [Candidatus Similichlamydia epinepheli]|uniref:hypothetical protein n=1 Tax=Candidatus Similichlamydia epinepheli TaxID=1903953 RepID=UPI000D347DCB|nr:hypothetical protein [Candidatus Similichlamydia epinepheli]